MDLSASIHLTFVVVVRATLVISCQETMAESSLVLMLFITFANGFLAKNQISKIQDYSNGTESTLGSNYGTPFYGAANQWPSGECCASNYTQIPSTCPSSSASYSADSYSACFPTLIMPSQEWALNSAWIKCNGDPTEGRCFSV